MVHRVLIAVVAALGISQFADAQVQVYTKWQKASDGRYYCSYLYKSKSTDSNYKQQYVFWSPQDPNWVYWANPKDNPDNKSGSDKYWARCPSMVHPEFGARVKKGEDIWSVLPNDKKPSKFMDLKDSDFPPATVKCPSIPGRTDAKRTIQCPPLLDPANLPK